jgi:tetratricopeptide (TPR) repeat protein
MNRVVSLCAAAAFICAALSFAAAQGATPDEAVRFHQARVANRPGDVEALLHLSRALMKRAEAAGEPRDYDEGWRILDQAATVEPESASIARQRATLLLLRHRFVLALALAEFELEKHPRDSELHAIAGDAALETGDIEAANRHYQQLHRMSPGFASLARLAHLEEAHGNFDQASTLMAKAYDSALSRGSPPEMLGWCRAVWGEAELKAKRNKSARRQYELGLSKTPNHPLLLEHLGELEEAEGRLQAAEAAYRKILEGNFNPEIQLRLAMLVEKHDAREAGRLRAEAHNRLAHLVSEGNEAFLRPLAELELEKGNFSTSAALAFRDLALRPNAESRALVRRVLEAAAAAGKPLSELPPQAQQAHTSAALPSARD